MLIKPKIWDRHGLEPWIEAAKKPLHHNVLAIALANKLARITWSVPAPGRHHGLPRGHNVSLSKPDAASNLAI